MVFLVGPLFTANVKCINLAVQQTLIVLAHERSRRVDAGIMGAALSLIYYDHGYGRCRMSMSYENVRSEEC